MNDSALSVTNPLRARVLFAEAIGTLARTDAIDARPLALMAETLAMRATPSPAAGVEELRGLVRRGLPPSRTAPRFSISAPRPGCHCSKSNSDHA